MKTTTRIPPIAIASLCAVLAACGNATGGGSPGGNGAPPPSYANVFVVGQKNNVPVIWNDGSASSLPIPTGETGNANGIAILGNSVFVVGYHGISSTTPCVWVDNARTDLPMGGSTAAGSANAVVVSGTKVIIAGDAWDDIAGYYTAVYWDLSGTTWTSHTMTNQHEGTATGVDLDSGGNPVFAGQRVYSTDTTSDASYWDASGNEHYCAVPSTARGSEASTGVRAFGTSIAVVGHYTDTSTAVYPCYWIDGIRTDLLGDAGGSPYRARALAYSGSDQLIVGECRGLDFIPGIWRNGTWSPLSTAGGMYNHASSIAISGSDLYVGGACDQSDVVGCFWKNGTRVDLAGVDLVNGIAVK